MLTRAYAVFCRVEEWLAAGLLLSIATLVFVSAIARTIHHPLNWAVDISVLLFAWLVFIGGDIVIRQTNLISVDMFLKMLPPKVQKTLNIVFYLMMIVFLMILVRYGIPLLLQNRKRLFQTLDLSYSWCTLAVPVGSLFMIISICIRLYRVIRTPVAPMNKEG